MRNQYGVSIIVLATAFSANFPALAQNVQSDFGPKKNSPQSQLETINKLPPDVVMDSLENTPSRHQSALEKLPVQPGMLSGKSIRSGVHR